MKSQNIELQIGDKIGFVIVANDVDENDKVLFLPVVEVTERDGERAYKYEFPDGTISSAAIRQSDLASHVIQIQPKANPEMICLSDRREEFVAALGRAEKSDLEVFADWERDSFVVVNRDSKKEYKVNLQTCEGKLHGDCECADFEFRKRICKHIGEVLKASLFGIQERV